MAKCKCSKCGSTRIVSNIVQNMPNGCFDVCTNPICGSPDELSILAPLIYDEIGINLCTTFAVGTDISTTYPTATNASVSVIDIAYTYGDENVEITQIAGRPNCYSVKLANLTVTFAVTLYDESCRALATLTPTAVYLPNSTTAATYDEDTNPTSVTLEIFAPYGVSYNSNNATPPVYTPALNSIGFLSSANVVTQGLNLYAIPKLLGLDTTDDEVTVGLTLILQSLYFCGYRVTSAGRISTPKGSIVSGEESDCIKFVCGNLLDRAIKPLDLSPPSCEGNLKKDCKKPCMNDCTDTLNTNSTACQNSCNNGNNSQTSSGACTGPCNGICSKTNSSPQSVGTDACLAAVSMYIFSSFGLPLCIPLLQRPIHHAASFLLDFLRAFLRFNVQSTTPLLPFWTSSVHSSASTSNPNLYAHIFFHRKYFNC